MKLIRKQSASRRGFTLIEVMMAVLILGIAIVPSITMIQQARIQARSVGLMLIGQNLAVAMTELIKRSGYNEIAYDQPMPDILDAGSAVNPLLEIPRSPVGSPTVEVANLPAGAPGGASAAQVEVFLQRFNDGDPDLDSLVIGNDTNYLALSRDQVAALNGYDDFASLTSEQAATLLDPQYAWAFYVTDGDPAGTIGAGAPNTGVKRVVIIVKWRDVRLDRVGFTMIETFVSEVGPRL